MKEKIFFINFIFFIILALFFIIFLIMQKPTEEPFIKEPIISQRTDEFVVDDFEKITDWKNFSNIKYKYSFNYPGDCQISGGDNYDWPEGFETAPRIHVLQGTDFSLSPLFNIEVQDPTAFAWKSEIIEKKVKEWAEEIRQINLQSSNPDKKVGELQDIIISGKKGYKFTLTNTFSDNGGYVLRSEQVYIFVANSEGVKFIISYPIANPASQKILNSFKFLEE